MDTLGQDDEAMIMAIKKMSDPDYEPERQNESDHDSSQSDAPEPLPASADPDLDRLQKDTALRQHLKIGTAFTGPKGVKQDYDFHKQQEKARRDEKFAEEFTVLDRAALSSGWMQRQIKAEQFKDDDEEFLKQYHAKRMAEFRSNVPQKQFGSVVELNTRNFVLNVEREADNCNVIVHLYEDQIIACRVLNELLPFLANNYRHDKFFIMDVNEADPNFDVIGLPCLLVYRQGNLTHTFTRLNDEIPGWTSSSRATVRDLEEFLQIQEVLGEKTNDLEEVSDAESFGDDDFFN